MLMEIAVDSVKNRSIIIDEKELPEKIEKSRKLNQELYHSVWLYDNDLREHFQKYKTIRSYRGKHTLPKIIFDIDKGSDTDDFVLERAQNFMRKLQQNWDIHYTEIDIWYSGTGYHFYIPDYFGFPKSEFIGTEVKNTLKEHFPEVDLSIYGATGLIRAPYSVNHKTGRFKIPLTAVELLQSKSDEIIKLAESNKIRDIEPAEADDKKDFSKYLVKDTVERESVKYRDEPTQIVTCMQHLYNRGSKQGSRHIEGMRLISAWRRQGVTMDGILLMMQNWAPSLTAYEIERMVKDVFEKAYRYGCSDNVMAKFCDSKCIFYQHKNYSPDIKSMEEIEVALSDRIKTLPNKKYIDLGKMFNIPTQYRIYEGEMVMIWGDTKIGKSTLVQNFVTTFDNLKWLYMSLENGIILDSRRLAQIANGLTKEQIEEYYKLDKKGLLNKISHVQMIETSIDVKDLRKIISDANVDAVVIDTVDQLKAGKITDYTQKTEALAIGLRDVTRELKTIIFPIHHINKNSAQDQDGRRRSMTIHSGKGSSAFEQKADKIISIEGERDQPARTVKSLGARDESPFTTTVYFDTATFKLRNIPIGNSYVNNSGEIKK